MSHIRTHNVHVSRSVFVVVDLRHEIWETQTKIKTKVKSAKNCMTMNLICYLVAFKYILIVMQRIHQGINNLAISSTEISRLKVVERKTVFFSSLHFKFDFTFCTIFRIQNFL